MAKRSRGTVRPGQRRPVVRRPASPAAPTAQPGATPVVRASGGLTEAELARAAEIEAAMLAEERTALATQKRQRERRRDRTEAMARPGGGLAAEEAVEYAYVSRDVKRIVRTGGLMLAILVGLWAILQATGSSPLA